MRQKAKRDANEREIVAALEQIGVTCYRVSSPGLPDLLTFYRGTWLPVEVKRPGGHLTPWQQETWTRTRFPIVDSINDAIALFVVKPKAGDAD